MNFSHFSAHASSVGSSAVLGGDDSISDVCLHDGFLRFISDGPIPQRRNLPACGKREVDSRFLGVFEKAIMCLTDQHSLRGVGPQGEESRQPSGAVQKCDFSPQCGVASCWGSRHYDGRGKCTSAPWKRRVCIGDLACTVISRVPWQRPCHSKHRRRDYARHTGNLSKQRLMPINVTNYQADHVGLPPSSSLVPQRRETHTPGAPNSRRHPRPRRSVLQRTRGRCETACTYEVYGLSAQATKSKILNISSLVATAALEDVLLSCAA